MEAIVSGRRNSWRKYQEQLKRQRNPKQRWKAIFAMAALLVAGAIVAGTGDKPAKVVSRPKAGAQQATSRELIGKDDVRLLLAGQNLVNISSERLVLDVGKFSLVVYPTIIPDLQAYMLRHLDRRNSRAIAIVAMEPDSGRVVAQTAFNRGNPAKDPCLAAAFPAASIFKLVTAAAAIENCNLRADSLLRFNGYKHTLYKRQLTMKTNRYSNVIRFKDAFAQSVNPVFGKLGWHRLGRATLEKYSSRFGFNAAIDFELPVGKSRVLIDQRPYNWAEVASGFNRRTTLSPLHGAMLAACVINNGKMMAPSMAAAIETGQGQPLYHQHPELFSRPIRPATARILQEMMETTVISGTASRTFRDRRRDKILRRLRLGGKTGSIYNQAHDTRYDWFIGWARDKKSGKKLAVAVMVAHGRYIGVRAAKYAKMLFKRYFDKLSNSSLSAANCSKKQAVRHISS